jgi:carbonic anhydrase
VSHGGWTEERAEEHFRNFAPMFEIGNAQHFVLSEAARLRRQYPKVLVAPLFYRVENNLLYLLKE